MKDIFKESELTIYPLGIHAGKITVFLYHPDRLEAFFSKESVQALLHEIGFIRNQGKNYLYSGYWKVYDRPHEKIRLFKKYEHSREKLIQLLSYGMRIEEIIAICSNTEIWQLVDCDCQYAS